MSVAVGIDLGTTNTVVAAVRDGVAFTITDSSSRRLIPSTVSFHPSGNVLVGQPAVERRLVDAENTVYSVKRLIGRAWSSDEVQRARARFAFKMKEGPKFGTIVVARGEEYTLPEISAFVLRYAKATAEAALGGPVDRAVITVPANFNDLQRAATKVAGKLAGLDVLRILNEPTAAALAYGQGAGQAGKLMEGIGGGGKAERVAVYDLGGGTFDITLLDLSGNVFEVLSTAGDTSLGGDDIDNLIADRMAEDLLKKHRYDARANPQAIGTLRVVAESVKRDLSTRDEVQVELNELAFGEGGKALPFTFKMSRTELEWACLSLVDRTFQVCQSALERAGLALSKIDRVILVGGSTRMPLVMRRVEQFFRQPPVMRVNPDEVVALGASIQAAALDRAAMRRRPGVSAAGSATISEESIVAALPGAAPGRKSVPDADDPPPSEPLPNLPVVTGYASTSTSVAGAPIGRVALEKRSARTPTAAKDAEDLGAAVGLPIISSSRHMRAAPAIEPDPILPIGVGDLDAVLPEPGEVGKTSPPAVPELAARPPPPPKRNAATQRLERPPMGSEPPLVPDQGRKLIFDLPGGQAPAQITPNVTQRAAEPAREVSPRTQLGGTMKMAPPAVTPVVLEAPSIPTTPSIVEPPPKPPLLIDVTPLSLNVETVGGYCDQLIEANTPVPCDRTRVFLTASDNQTTVFVRVAQGASNKFAENTFLGELELSGLAPDRRGETQIAVTFEIDADGILNVRAKDVKTGTETRTRMHLLGAQTDETELAAMRARQARHAVAV